MEGGGDGVSVEKKDGGEYWGRMVEGRGSRLMAKSVIRGAWAILNGIELN